jgi:outer membrane protein OmpA-like peptidoglycan-associated protein
VADSVQYTVPRIHFAKSKASLDADSKKYLDQFAKNLSQESRRERIKLYVLGMASDEEGFKNQWVLSAQRAQEVAGYLKNVLPDNSQYPVYAWGAGTGGKWVGESGYATKETQVFIAVLR